MGLCRPLQNLRLHSESGGKLLQGFEQTNSMVSDLGADLGVGNGLVVVEEG